MEPNVYIQRRFPRWYRWLLKRQRVYAGVGHLMGADVCACVEKRPFSFQFSIPMETQLQRCSLCSFLRRPTTLFSSTHGLLIMSDVESAAKDTKQAMHEFGESFVETYKDVALSRVGSLLHCIQHMPDDKKPQFTSPNTARSLPSPRRPAAAWPLHPRSCHLPCYFPQRVLGSTPAGMHPSSTASAVLLH